MLCCSVELIAVTGFNFMWISAVGICCNEINVHIHAYPWKLWGPVSLSHNCKNPLCISKPEVSCSYVAASPLTRIVTSDINSFCFFFFPLLSYLLCTSAYTNLSKCYWTSGTYRPLCTVCTLYNRKVRIIIITRSDSPGIDVKLWFCASQWSSGMKYMYYKDHDCVLWS